MLEARATVIALDGSDALVEAQQGGGCGHCSSAGGCGSGKLSKLFANGSRHFRVQNNIGAQVGETVRISVADGVLLKSSALLYLLPLFLLLVGGGMGTELSQEAAMRDAYAAVGAATGLIVGFLLARVWAKKVAGRNGVQLVMSRDTGCTTIR